MIFCALDAYFSWACLNYFPNSLKIRETAYFLGPGAQKINLHRVEGLLLSGEMVEDCLWHPGFQVRPCFRIIVFDMFLGAEDRKRLILFSVPFRRRLCVFFGSGRVESF